MTTRALFIFAIVAGLASAQAGSRKLITSTYYASWYNSSGTRSIGYITGNGTKTEYFPIDSASVTGLGFIFANYNNTVDSTSPYYRIVGGSGFHMSDNPAYPLDSVAYEDGADGGGWDWTNGHQLDSLIAVAHRKGIKVIAPIGAINPPASTGMLYSILPDSARTHTLAKTIAAYAQRKGFDGIDYNLEMWSGEMVDWRADRTYGNYHADSNFVYHGERIYRSQAEGNINHEPPNATYWIQISTISLAEMNGRWFRLLRQELNAAYAPTRPTINSACIWAPTWFNASCDTSIDYYLLENAAWAVAWNGNIGQNGVWFPMAYAKGTSADYNIDLTSATAYNLTSATSGIMAWLAERPAAKTMLEIWGGGYTYPGATKILGPYRTYTAETSQRYIREYQIGNGTVAKYWDEQRQHAYAKGVLADSTPNIWWGAPGQAAGDSVWISYVDSNAVNIWMHWIDSAGLAGAWTYDLGYDFDRYYPIAGGRNLVLEAVIRGAQGGTEAEAPPVRRSPFMRR